MHHGSVRAFSSELNFVSAQLVGARQKNAIYEFSQYRMSFPCKPKYVKHNSLLAYIDVYQKLTFAP